MSPAGVEPCPAVLGELDLLSLLLLSAGPCLDDLDAAAYTARATIAATTTPPTAHTHGRL